MEIEIPAHRMYHKANWGQFTQILKDSYINIPSDMTECKLDKMVNKLNHILDKALDKSCSIAKARSIDPNNPWWTPQLKDMRHKVTKTYDKYKNDRKNEEVEKLYRKQQKEYKNKKGGLNETMKTYRMRQLLTKKPWPRNKKSNNQHPTESYNTKALIRAIY